jgi:hypothetical protein
MIKQRRESTHHMCCSYNSFIVADIDKWSNFRVCSANVLRCQRFLELHPENGIKILIQDAEGEVVVLAEMVAVTPPFGT